MPHLIDIFLEPTKVFADLKDKPTFWLPLLLMMMVNVALMLGYFMTVDPDWFSEHLLLASGKDMTAAEIAQFKQVKAGIHITGYISAISAAIMMLVMMSILAVYYLLAGKITGNVISFRQGFSLAAWSSMPMLVGLLIGIVGVVTMAPQTGFESLMLTRLDPLLVQLPFDHAWSSFAKSFDLIMFWSIFLAALGWRLWGRTGWGQAVMVAAIPALVIYGIWATVAFMN